MRTRWIPLVFRVGAAIVSVWVVGQALDRVAEGLSVWVRAPLVFAAAKLTGDLVALTVFRSKIVLFVEDVVWELAGFVVLGVVAAGLIRVTGSLIGGPVSPDLPAAIVYVVYLLAESRQRDRAGGE
jgi:hypothetical protein